ncbi:MAG: hypothetical protein CBD88_07870 [Flavobacteriales bacterium TMED228]|nr:MAG: hypothetical protein CBD88_07870 [Flavobacteriales bacterium TMED228]|tara:strand:- start:5857 stop:7509 length:1653 start_codon:yes stop_codon:yes gene_type:complete
MEKDGYLWSIPVLDGFSFSQATNASEVTLNEMEDSTGKSRRGRKMFTDSLSAAEFSFSTYIRPFISAGTSGGSNLDGGAIGAAGATGGAKKGIADKLTHHHAVEEALWVAMAGRNVYTATTGKYAAPTSGTPTGGAISRIALSGNTSTNGGTANTYTFNVSNSSLGGTTTGASTNSSTGANAVVTLTLTEDSGTRDVTATISERGIGWVSGETITIVGTALGGSTTADDVVITVQSESAHSDATDLDINFYDSSRAAVGTFNLYYVFSDRTEGRLIYKLKDAVVNEASIDFDIDGIATVNWSGFAGQIEEVLEDTTDADTIGAGKYHADNTSPVTGSHGAGAIFIDTNDSDRFYINPTAGNNWWAAIDEGTTDTNNFIRNRLTQLTLAPETAFQSATTFTKSGVTGQSYETTYSVAITGGNVTISNNISFLTPEEIGKVNQPIEHVTGTRTVTGSLTCYLASSDTATNRSRDLFADLVSDINTVINKFAITLKVGGTDTSKPRFEINVPTAHLEIPSHSVEDVISLETNFHGLGTGMSEGDEVTLKYIGA